MQSAVQLYRCLLVEYQALGKQHTAQQQLQQEIILQLFLLDSRALQAYTTHSVERHRQRFIVLLTAAAITPGIAATYTTAVSTGP